MAITQPQHVPYLLNISYQNYTGVILEDEDGVLKEIERIEKFEPLIDTLQTFWRLRAMLLCIHNEISIAQTLINETIDTDDYEVAFTHSSFEKTPETIALLDRSYQIDIDNTQYQFDALDLQHYRLDDAQCQQIWALITLRDDLEKNGFTRAIEKFDGIFTTDPYILTEEAYERYRHPRTEAIQYHMARLHRERILVNVFKKIGQIVGATKN